MKRLLVVLAVLASMPAGAADTMMAEKLVLNATATRIDLDVDQRKGIEIQNRGPNSIECVLNAALTAPTVTLTKARSIAAGDVWSISFPPHMHVWCKATSADQVTGAATIVTEVR